MTAPFDPGNLVMGFFLAKRLVYPETLLLLALLRVALGQGAARWLALLAALGAAAACAAVFAPALGLAAGSWYPLALQAMNHGQGLSLLAALSGVFALSAWMPGRGPVWIDWLHALLVLGLLGLWAATMY